jgi:hypothetical protein
VPVRAGWSKTSVAHEPFQKSTLGQVQDYVLGAFVETCLYTLDDPVFYLGNACFR